jgi:hypothetical protein
MSFVHGPSWCASSGSDRDEALGDDWGYARLTDHCYAVNMFLLFIDVFGWHEAERFAGAISK